MAMSSCVVRRAASCSSSLIALATRYARAPLANRSPGSSSFPPLLHLRLLPFSTDSPESPEFPNSKQTASGTSDKVSLLDGLAFDSIKVNYGSMALWRKTKDEIVEIEVREDYDRTEKCECLWMYVKILYGKEFKKCMKFDIISLPRDQEGQVVIRNVTMSVDHDNIEEVHVDEMEGFLEKRGINHNTLEFIVKYAEERRANLKYGVYINN